MGNPFMGEGALAPGARMDCRGIGEPGAKS